MGFLRMEAARRQGPMLPSSVTIGPVEWTGDGLCHGESSTRACVSNALYVVCFGRARGSQRPRRHAPAPRAGSTIKGWTYVQAR